MIEKVAEIKKRSSSTMSPYFDLLYLESCELAPPLNLIVELGVGWSSHVLNLVAIERKCKFIGVDKNMEEIKGQKKIDQLSDCHLIEADDILVGMKFKEVSRNLGIKPKINILLIDTSHLYSCTKLEIDFWFPYLEKKAKIFFHDTNLKKQLKYKDGSFDEKGWDNERGVIRAIEEFFHKNMDEEIEFKTTISDEKNILWTIQHFPWSAGFTILGKNC